jgi:serine/threonine protein phosphatase PrpC
MEDAHTAVLELEDGFPEVNSFFAVYDGHGGA